MKADVLTIPKMWYFLSFKGFEQELLAVKDCSPVCSAIFEKLFLDLGAAKKSLFRGVKTPKVRPIFFCDVLIHIKNKFCKKKWVKTAIPALSSGQSNLHTPMWGPSRQLDDQYRNPNINNRDHLVGQ